MWFSISWILLLREASIELNLLKRMIPYYCSNLTTTTISPYEEKWDLMAAASNSTGTLYNKFTGENSPTINVKIPSITFPVSFVPRSNQSQMSHNALSSLPFLKLIWTLYELTVKLHMQMLFPLQGQIWWLCTVKNSGLQLHLSLWKDQIIVLKPNLTINYPISYYHGSGFVNAWPNKHP